MPPVNAKAPYRLEDEPVPARTESAGLAVAEAATPARPDAPAITVEAVDKVFCADLWASSRYALKDLLKPAALWRRASAQRRLRAHEFHALRGVSFTIARGETVAVLGLRRSGKSTLANVVGGLYPPDRGRVAVAGHRVLVNALGAGMRPMLTLRENVRFRAALYGADRAWLKARTDEVLAFAELTDQADRPLFNVDPLHVKRLGLAIALHLEGDTFIFDETLSFRDPVIRDRAAARFAALLNGRTTMIFSQDRELLWTYAARGLVLDRGQIVFDGPLDEAIGTFDERLETERLRGNQDATLSSVSALLDDDAEDDEIPDDAHAIDMARERNGAEDGAGKGLTGRDTRGGRRHPPKGPSFRLESLSLNGLPLTADQPFWFVLRPNETVDLQATVSALRDVDFDAAWIGLHLPFMSTPIGSVPLTIEGLPPPDPQGCTVLRAQRTVSLNGRFTVPPVSRGIYGVTLQVSRGGMPPTRDETLKIVIFGVVAPAPAGKGVVLDWSGTAVAAARTVMTRDAPDTGDQRTRGQEGSADE